MADSPAPGSDSTAAFLHALTNIVTEMDPNAEVITSGKGILAIMATLGNEVEHQREERMLLSPEGTKVLADHWAAIRAECTVNIEGLEPAAVLAALASAADPCGFGWLDKDASNTDLLGQARAQLACGPYVDYFAGRAIKMGFNGPTINTRRYDEDNGVGAAGRVVARLREAKAEGERAGTEGEHVG